MKSVWSFFGLLAGLFGAAQLLQLLGFFGAGFSIAGIGFTILGSVAALVCFRMACEGSSWVPPATWCCLMGAAGTSGLLWACFQPLALGSYLGWIALVPFLVLVRVQIRPTITYFLAFLSGLAFFVPALEWMSVADKAMVTAWLTLSVYCALYFPAALYCVRLLERWKLPLVVSVPLAWVALEYVRCFLLTGFPWYLLAHTQHDLLPMIQISDIGGVFLVSFVVVAVNAFLFDCAYQFPEVRAWFSQAELEPYRYYSSVEICNRGALADWLFRRNILLEGAALIAVLIGVCWYGQYRLGQDQFRLGPTVCLLQSNLDQRIRESNMDRDAQRSWEHFRDLWTRAAFNQNPPPDLLIWPETSYHRAWAEISTEMPVSDVSDEWKKHEIAMRRELADLTFATQRPHLIGINTHFLDKNAKHRRYNSALMVTPAAIVNGELKANTDRFDKVHRVPFGEYVPLVEWLPFLAWLTPYEGDFGIQAGEKLTRFELGDLRLGVLLCYEDTDPFMARRYVQHTEDGPPVHFLVNMSNDGWFAGSREHEEHLAVSRFRAIECRRAMVRAVNMGVSAVIDGNGRVLKPTQTSNAEPPMWVVRPDAFAKTAELPMSQWHEFKSKHGVLKAAVPLDTRFSFYVFAGDWVPVGCWLVLFGAAAWSIVSRRRAKLASRAP